MGETVNVECVWMMAGLSRTGWTLGPFLNTKYANFGLADYEVRTWRVRTSKYKLPRTGGRTCYWNSSGLDDVTNSARLLTVLRPHVDIYVLNKAQASPRLGP